MWNTPRSRSKALAIMLVLAALAVPSLVASHHGKTVLPAASWRPASDEEGVAPLPAFENTPAVEATFLRESYAPGSFATLALWRPEGELTLQVLQSGPEQVTTVGNIDMQGVPMGVIAEH